MGALTVIPRRQQLTQFVEALRTDRVHERRPVYERLTKLTPEEWMTSSPMDSVRWTLRVTIGSGLWPTWSRSA